MAIYYPSPHFAQIFTNPQDSKSIKDAGNELKALAGCSKCQQPESDTVKLMKCARCKIALYCSREVRSAYLTLHQYGSHSFFSAIEFPGAQCQTGDWPTHKSECKITADQKLHAITDLLTFFLGNHFLHSYLEVALILELGLKPMGVLDRLFTAQFYIGTEPCDINDFQRLWSPEFDFDPSKKVKMKGMFQLLGLTTSSTHPHDVPSARSRLTPDFADFRRQADEMGHEGDTLVQCEFVAMTDGTVSNQFCVVSIGLSAFLLANELEEITVSKGINKPLTVATCLEFINMHIRQDTENQLCLRSRMNVQDVRKINYTGNSINTGQPWIETYKKTLKEKVSRESVYAI